MSKVVSIVTKIMNLDCNNISLSVIAYAMLIEEINHDVLKPLISYHNKQIYVKAKQKRLVKCLK
jgi:hypothetical protein